MAIQSFSYLSEIENMNRSPKMSTRVTKAVQNGVIPATVSALWRLDARFLRPWLDAVVDLTKTQRTPCF
jgi:hypothetical protein